MKIKELRDLLIRMGNNYDNNEVCVEIVRRNSVGGTPIARVKSGFNGFDWDSGKFILHTEIPLMEVTKDENRDIKIDNILD